MSVINQVLSDLEKRGASTLPGEPAVRAVPPQKNWLKPALLAAALVVLALVLAMQWRSRAQSAHSSRSAEGTLSAPKPPQERAPVMPPSLGGAGNVAAAPAASPVSAPAAPVAPARAQPQQVAATGPQETGSDTNKQQGSGAVAVPTMRMSFELSTIPLPSSLRALSPSSEPARSGSGTSAPPAASASGNAKTARLEAAPPPRNAVGAPETKLPASAASPATPAGRVDKQVKQLSAQQQADNEFRKATGLLQQGRSSEALAAYEAALRFDAGHDSARQALVALLLENKRNPDAERILQEGLEHNPKHGSFAMLLARLQVERDALQPALETLLKSLPYAGQQPDYQAFVAALLQRLNRHQEAVAHYRTALQQSPASGIWLMGLGISLQALQRNEEARDAFKRALESRALNAELQEFVRQRLRYL